MSDSDRRYSEAEMGSTGPGAVEPTRSGLMGESSLSELEDWTAEAPHAPASDEFGGECQKCGRYEPVRPVRLMHVMSFVVFTNWATHDLVLCRECSTRAATVALAQSATLGWWGFPWGLMTFKALWLDLKVLFTWSRLPKAATALLVLVSLSLPLAFVGWIVQSESTPAAKERRAERKQAEATGNVASDEVANLVERGHEKYGTGDYQGAFSLYRKAHRELPDSSVINHMLADTSVMLGDLEQALPYAEKAYELDTEPGNTALYSWLQLVLGNEERARRLAADIEGTDGLEEGDFYWLQMLYIDLEDWSALERLAVAGAQLGPEEASYYRGLRLTALVGLDRVEDARTLWQGMSPQDRALPVAEMAGELLNMRTEPRAEVEGLIERWVEDDYSIDSMERFAAAADRAGELPAVRSRIAAWLADPSTPGEALLVARPWFEDEPSWFGLLDRRLETSPDPMIGLLRIAELDRVTQRDQITQIARPLVEGQGPLARVLAAMYLDAKLTPMAPGAANDFLERYVSEHPDREVAALLLAERRIETSPESARTLLESLSEKDRARRALQAEEDQDLAWRNALRLAGVELLIAEGDLGEAERLAQELVGEPLDPYRRPASLSVLRAEIALARGKWKAVRRYVDEVLDQEPQSWPPAMVLRWAAQAAQGKKTTWKMDVAKWRRAMGSEVEQVRSYSGQAILVAEGVTDLDHLRAVVGAHQPETIRLVVALERAAVGSLDGKALAPVLASPRPQAFAVRVARQIDTASSS